MQQRQAKISSVFTVTTRSRGRESIKHEETIEVTGSGQATVKHVRSQYPPYTRIVLEGHMIDGDFKVLKFPIW